MPASSRSARDLWSLVFCNQQQRLHRGLPFRRIVFMQQLGAPTIKDLTPAMVRRV
jgi:hypothetical protein